MANIITISRILMAFIVIALLFVDTQAAAITAFVMTILVMWFDGLDGYVARKFNETSKIGALLDILGDRIVENVFWIAFSTLGYINVAVPIIVVARGIITDSIRSLALTQGYSAFGETTMQQNKFAKFIVASNFSRFTYALCKALAFAFIILGTVEFKHNQLIFDIGVICTYISVVFCVVRGLPVIIESKRFFKAD